MNRRQYKRKPHWRASSISSKNHSLFDLLSILSFLDVYMQLWCEYIWTIQRFFCMFSFVTQRFCSFVVSYNTKYCSITWLQFFSICKCHRTNWRTIWYNISLSRFAIQCQKTLKGRSLWMSSNMLLS